MSNSSSPVRVTHLLHTMAYGGIETVIINWFQNLDPEVVKANLVIFTNPGDTQKPFQQAAEEAGLDVEFISWSSRKPVFSASREMKRLLKKHNTQILHTHNTYADIVGLVAGRWFGCRLVSTIYVWEGGDFGFRRKILQQLDAWALQRFDLLTAQCEKTIRDSAEWGFRPSEVVLAPSGFRSEPKKLSSEDRNRLRAERGVDSPDTLVVCNVARFYPEKAQDLALRCWARVVKNFPEAQFWLYGVGPLEDELRALTIELEIESSVKFMGFASDLALELELCDVNFHPSHNEGIPLAICSAMAAALPIVVARVGGIPEVISHNESGLLVNDNNEEGFVSELSEVLASASLRKKLGGGALRFINEEYSLEAAAKSLEKTYINMLQF